MRVLIDPGHGGNDPGAIHGDIHEADLNLAISNRVVAKLKLIGHEASATRFTDCTLSLPARAAFQKLNKYEIFVSIHCDSFPNPAAEGFSVYNHPENLKIPSRNLASNIFFTLKDLCQGFLRPRYVKAEDFAVLRLTDCPAALVECGFMSNDSDRGKLLDHDIQDKVACAIALGINKYELAAERDLWP